MVLELLFNRKRSTILDSDYITLGREVKRLSREIIKELKSRARESKFVFRAADREFSPLSISITVNGSLTMSNSQIARALTTVLDDKSLFAVKQYAEDLNAFCPFMHVHVKVINGKNIIVYTIKDDNLVLAERVLMHFEREFNRLFCYLDIPTCMTVSRAKWFEVVNSLAIS